MKEIVKIPVIDVFAGPGGLCEGFNSLYATKGKVSFGTVLSIEKDANAHKTLELRAFFHQFKYEEVPTEYFQYLRGEILREKLWESFPTQSQRASEIAWNAELGGNEFPNRLVDKRIFKALNGNSVWVLIGGPPCQAYSLAGRSRMRSKDPETFEKDPRHFLYKEYLRILCVHKPPVFVMENVRGLLSSKVNGFNIFKQILNDLQNPSIALSKSGATGKIRYNVYPVVDYGVEMEEDDPACFVVKSEKHGIPQARHRVILLGVRSDIKIKPTVLKNRTKTLGSWKVINSLPKIRSQLSNRDRENSSWADSLKIFIDNINQYAPDAENALIEKVITAGQKIRPKMNTGGQFVKSKTKSGYSQSWYTDKRIQGVCNHRAKSHMAADLHRYFYAACFASVYRKSPTLRDFPSSLLPGHSNVEQALKDNGGLFSDRFRVQVKTRPATTITSHIAKDGHYYIHPDPVQCRSLTVREAARIQTFPDNYFFEGPQTSQYQQVGNAVPPLLAREIAGIVRKLIEDSEMT